MAIGESRPSLMELMAMPNEALAKVDPVVMNLVVASGIESLAELDINRYVGIADQWAAEIEERIPVADAEFRRTPDRWRHDLDLCHMAVIAWYVGQRLGVREAEQVRRHGGVVYLNPNDQFLTGVIDRRRGTCASMPVLWVALAWRLRWPLSLACCWSHVICRYDDGRKTFNVEAMRSEEGNLCSPSDEWFLKTHKIPRLGVECGSDLRALTPRQMLAVFLGHRARHYNNKGQYKLAERDELLARSLFPENRYLSVCQIRGSLTCQRERFERDEPGNMIDFLNWLQASIRFWFGRAEFPLQPRERFHYENTAIASPPHEKAHFENIAFASAPPQERIHDDRTRFVPADSIFESIGQR